MGEWTKLMARDGHEFQAYLAAPPGQPRGAVVIGQEIFGVNAHIRAVTDGYAAQGFVAIAPSFFDRIRGGVQLGYSAEELQQGVGYMTQVSREQLLADLSAAFTVVKHAGRVAAIGYCWGGYIAYLAACKLPVACAVSYYGGPIARNLQDLPSKPVLYHWGEKDSHIPLEQVEKVRAADPQGVHYLYPAGHGFNCSERTDFDAPSAKLALERTLAFLKEHLSVSAP